MSDTPNPNTPIIAYTSRPSINPITGLDGEIRNEWKLEPYNWQDTEQRQHLEDHFGHNFFTCLHGDEDVIVYQRTIKYEIVGEWIPHDSASSEIAAMENIGDWPITPVDERFVAIVAERMRQAEIYAQEQERDRLKHLEREEKRAHQARSQAAFDRLRDGKDREGKPLTQAFMDWVGECGKDKERMAILYVDREFRSYYDPVLASVDVRSKKKALQAFMAYVELRDVVEGRVASSPTPAVPATPATHTVTHWLDHCPLRKESINEQ